MNDMLINEILKLFNALVLRYVAGDRFEPIAPLPEWFQCLGIPEPVPDTPFDVAASFPFLQDFLPEAQAFWSSKGAGRLRSGIWLESLPDDRELALGASAMTILGAPFLMIESPQYSYEELYATIQTGRELALTHDNLSQTECAVRQDRDVLSHRLEARNIELEKTNRKLRESEARFRLLFEQLFDAQVMFTDKGDVDDANQAACRLFGRTCDDMRQTAVSSLFMPAEAERVWHLLQHLPEGAPAFLGELSVRGAAGEPVPVEAGGVALKIGGQRYGLVSFRDITERKQLQTQLQQAQKLEAIGTLAGGIAHDFNNILAAILGYSELALLDVPQDSTAHMNLRDAIKASHRGKDLVKRILAFSRRDDQHRKPLAMAEVVAETMKMVRALIPTSIDIQTRIEPKIGIVAADPTQIHQVILNLCTNAAHAIGEKRGTIAVRLERRVLDDAPERIHSELRPGAYACLTIADNGVGIPSDLLGKIFEPYFTTKESGQGTGIGLAVAHGIIRNHGGVVTATSQVGEGSTFEVYLPTVQGKTPQEARPKVITPTGSESILFVDDEQTLQDIGKQMLQRLGYRVVVSDSSRAALALFNAAPEDFDLVITDMTMPLLTGEELAQRILTIRPDIPVILCTGYSEKITPDTARKLGIRAYLMKPLTIDQLARTVRKALDGEPADP